MERELRSRKYKNKILRDGVYPGFRLETHPRRFNKPLTCRSGLHKGLITKVINGIPSLYCTKCGEYIGQGIHDKTWSKQEIHKIKNALKTRDKPRTTKERMGDVTEAMELLRTKFTDKEIKIMVEKRRRQKAGLM